MKKESARAKAKMLHEEMLRANPDYRQQWEAVTATFRTLLADADFPDDTAKTEAQG